MAGKVLTFQQQRTTQPQGAARVDWSNPIARGLLIAGFPETAVSRSATVLPTTTGTVSLAATPVGRAFSIDAANSHFSFGTGAQSTTGRVTVLALAIGRATGRGDFVTRWSTGANGADLNQFNLLVGLTASKPQFFISSGVASGNSGASSISITTSRYHAVVGSYSPSDCRVYVDGKIGSSGTGGGLSLSSVCTQALIVGNNAALDGYLAGAVAMFAIWDRQLSDREVKQVSENPWQLFAPDTRRIWVPSAGGGATATLTGASSTASAGTVTATGAATATVSGASATANAGTVTASVPATATITGAAATASTGTVSAFGAASITLTGASASASVGTLSATGAAQITLTGAASTAGAGTISASAGGSAVATLTGVASAASAGTVAATGAALAAITGASAAASAGTITASAPAGGATATITGAGATASAGSITVTGAAMAVITGAAAAASAGTIAAASGIKILPPYITVFLWKRTA